MPSKQAWIPANGLTLEDAAYDSVIGRGNFLVTAGPGSGKTELLAQKACYLLQTGACKSPQRILAISFKNDSATNLKNRVEQRCGKTLSSSFDSLTFDGFCKMVLDKYRYALPQSCRPLANYVINDGVILGRILGSVKPSQQDAILEAAELPLVTDTPQNIKWRELLYSDKSGKSYLSFSMIRMLAQYILDTHYVIRRLIKWVYRFIFVDEYQDTTKWQYDLLSSISDSSTEVIAVGDNKQRIMLWAGAMRNAFDIFMRDYSPTCKTLLMNHRSAPRLVELQRLFYDSLGEKPLPVQASEKWRPRDGNIVLLIAEKADSEARFVASRIYNLIKGGVKPECICVLCKQKVKSYTVTLSQLLASYDVRLQNDAMRLELQYDRMVIFLLLTIKSAFGSCEPTERGMINDTIEGIQNNDSSISGRLDFSRIMSVLLSSLRNKLKTNRSSANFREALWGIINMFSEDLFTDYFITYKSRDALEMKIQYLSEALSEECLLFPEMCGAVDRLLGKGIVPAITIHKSKGLEYDYVFFLGLEDSAFWNFRNQSEEDRCAFFVALSRAKKEVVFTFCENRSGRVQNHTEINEFFEVLKQPGIANIIHA